MGDFSFLNKVCMALWEIDANLTQNDEFDSNKSYEILQQIRIVYTMSPCQGRLSGDIFLN